MSCIIKLRCPFVTRSLERIDGSKAHISANDTRMLNEVNPKRFMNRSPSSSRSDILFFSPSISTPSSYSDSTSILSGKKPCDYTLYRFTTSDLLAFQSPGRANNETREREKKSYFDALAKSMIIAASMIMDQMLLSAVGAIGSETMEKTSGTTRFGQY